MDGFTEWFLENSDEDWEEISPGIFQDKNVKDKIIWHVCGYVDIDTHKCRTVVFTWENKTDQQAKNYMYRYLKPEFRNKLIVKVFERLVLTEQEMKQWLKNNGLTEDDLLYGIEDERADAFVKRKYG